MSDCSLEQVIRYNNSRSRLACEQAIHLGDIVKSTRASIARGETNGELARMLVQICLAAVVFIALQTNKYFYHRLSK